MTEFVLQRNGQISCGMRGVCRNKNSYIAFNSTELKRPTTKSVDTMLKMMIQASVVLFCTAVADAAYTKVITGFNSNSVIMGLSPGSLQSGDEFGIKVDIW